MKSLLVALSLLSLGLLVSPHTLAQSPSPSPSPAPPAPVALKAVQLLDVRTVKVTSDVYVTVENHRIKSIEATPAQGIQIIDLSSSFVMPGMVDCHAHILGDLGDLSPGSEFRMSSARKTLWGMRNLKVWLSKVSPRCAMPVKMISVTGNSLCATRSMPAGSTVHACSLQEISFRSMAAMEIPGDSLRPIRNCRVVRTLPTQSMTLDARPGATLNTVPTGLN